MIFNFRACKTREINIKKILYSVFIKSILNNLSGDASDNRIRRSVLYHNRSGSNNGATPQSHTV